MLQKYICHQLSSTKKLICSCTMNWVGVLNLQAIFSGWDSDSELDCFQVCCVRVYEFQLLITVSKVSTESLDFSVCFTVRWISLQAFFRCLKKEFLYWILKCHESDRMFSFYVSFLFGKSFVYSQIYYLLLEIVRVR